MLFVIIIGSLVTAKALQFGPQSDLLFSRYVGEAPEPFASRYVVAWETVREAVEAAGLGDPRIDTRAFEGALEAFVTPGPSEATLAALPKAEAEFAAAMSETAASYGVVANEKLSWGTAYRTLNRRVGAFFCGVSLWPRVDTDAPNWTLYFGSGSPANPEQLFVRLECVPRVDVACDARYCETYYDGFSETCLKLMQDDSRFVPYVSKSPYARAALAPSGVRVFFDSTDESALAEIKAACMELAGQWGRALSEDDDKDDKDGDDGRTSSRPPLLDPLEQKAMARRDAVVRRVAAESSPDNENRALVFGSYFPLTKDLLAGDTPLVVGGGSSSTDLDRMLRS
ncbi:hypothetical protein CTAYLR_000911 [Chrysophaeum taylorii]|uniref:Uncharacterized protein n=1 Tax=Chrysophaeum taylorii TaxID=2483200 RepID=A0AAD7UHR6_9STRA|nr:hypothetical protein CTAYLR_000911 [Chrysophaeum taylorii]